MYRCMNRDRDVDGDRDVERGVDEDRDGCGR